MTSEIYRNKETSHPPDTQLKTTDTSTEQLIIPFGPKTHAASLVETDPVLRKLASAPPPWEQYTADPKLRKNSTPGWPTVEVWRKRLMGKTMIDPGQQGDPRTTFKRSDLPRDTLVHPTTLLYVTVHWRLHVTFDLERVPRDKVKVVDCVYYEDEGFSEEKKRYKQTEYLPWRPEGDA